MMMKLRSSQIFLAIFCLSFACISWLFLSQKLKLGSFEARSLLSHRPAIIEWNRYETDRPLVLKEIVSKDSFINFSPAEFLELVTDPDGMPSLYVKDKAEIIYPVYMRSKNSGFAYFLVRELSERTNPTFALSFSLWLMSIICFTMSLFFIGLGSTFAIPFTILACLLPQFFYYLNSKYHEGGLGFLFIMGILLCLKRAEKKRTFLLIGLLMGFTLYLKMMTILFVPAFLILFWDKVKKNFTPLLIGIVPFVLFIFSTLHPDVVGREAGERNLSKGVSEILFTLKHFFGDILSPEVSLLYGQLDGMKSLEAIFSIKLLSLLSLVIGIACTVIVAWNFMPRKALGKIVTITILYSAGVAMISRGVDEDFYMYAAMGAYFLTVIFLANLNHTMFRRLGFVIFLIFLLTRIFVFSSWKKQYDVSRTGFDGCAWVYDCMVKDWEKNNFINDLPLITLYFLDVGQIEFFSGEKIIPVHFASSFTKDPSEEQVADFLKKFPHHEFRVLSSDTALGNGRNPGFYLSEEKLNSLDLKIDVLNTYHYPALGKSYQLLRVVRGQNQASGK